VVLITGAAGFVGKHLLAELGDRASATDADVTDPDGIARAIREVRPAAVVHLAAVSSVGESWESAAEVWRVNVLGTVNVLEAVGRESPDARVLVVSTGEVYGHTSGQPATEDRAIAPVSPYAASKAAAEIACARAARADGVDIVIARAFPHAGPGQDERFAIGSWTRQIARLELDGGGALHVGDLDAQRDITDVRDVCRAYRLLLDERVAPDVYNVASGGAVGLRDVAEALVAMARCPVSLRQDPSRLRRADIRVLRGDSSRLEAATGWRPDISLETTLADALEDARRVVAEERMARV
jgi:GDP-4-dehydro-6-deoxy-D-mannose reductase